MSDDSDRQRGVGGWTLYSRELMKSRRGSSKRHVGDIYVRLGMFGAFELSFVQFGEGIIRNESLVLINLHASI